MITRQELDIIEKLGELWNEFLALPEEGSNPFGDRTETQRDIHNLQNRSAARATWRQIMKDKEDGQTNPPAQG